MPSTDPARHPPLPQSLRGVVAQSARWYSARPLHYFLLALIFQGPALVILDTIGAGAVDVGRAGGESDPVCGLLGATVPALVGSLISGVLYVVLSATVATSMLLDLAGRPVGVTGSVAKTFHRLRPLVGGTFLALGIVVVCLGMPLAALGLVQGCYGGAGSIEVQRAVRAAGEAAAQTPVARVVAWAALLAGIAYVVHAGVKWVVMPQAAVVEGGSAAQVLWRSRNLLQGRWWRVALTLLALLVIQTAVSWVVGIPPTFLSYALESSTGDFVRGLIRAFSQVVSLPLGAIGATLLYLHLRKVRESRDEDAVVKEFSATAAAND